jgi:hypothetical protein
LRWEVIKGEQPFFIFFQAPDVGADGRINALARRAPLRTPVLGRLFRHANPGLKPWAMMYNRFAVNPTGS